MSNDFITLACPSCGGNLSVTQDSTRFACPYCKRQHLIRRNEGHVSVTPVIESLERMSAGVDRHASELAIQRLRKDRRAAIDRIKDQEETVKYRKRALTNARDELKGTRKSFVTSLVIASVMGVAAAVLILIAMIVGGTGFLCCGLLIAPVGVVPGVMGILARMKIAPLEGRVGTTQKMLDKEYDRLDELKLELDRIDGELDHHTRIVSL